MQAKNTATALAQTW